MSRTAKILMLCAAAVALALTTAACGEQNISVPNASNAIQKGAKLFNQRCSGCHTLSYAAAHGSAANIRTAQAINGPNFDQRCERPIDRVMYAIENGGFSGAYMPQNVVVGQDAVDVAEFVATYAGRKAPNLLGIVRCQKRSIGTLPAGSGQASANAGGATATTASGG